MFYLGVCVKSAETDRFKWVSVTRQCVEMTHSWHAKKHLLLTSPFAYFCHLCVWLRLADVSLFDEAGSDLNLGKQGKDTFFFLWRFWVFHTAAGGFNTRELVWMCAHECMLTAEEWQWRICVFWKQEDETGRRKRKEKTAPVAFRYSLILLSSGSLFLFNFLLSPSIFFRSTRLVLSTCCPYLSSLFFSSPWTPSSALFSRCSSQWCSSPSLCLWFSCPLGPDTVPCLRKVCVLVPAGWATERFQTRSERRG